MENFQPATALIARGLMNQLFGEKKVEQEVSLWEMNMDPENTFWWFHIAIEHLLNMAIEIVNLPTKKCDFPEFAEGKSFLVETNHLPSPFY